MQPTVKFDIVIVGSGPAGVHAAHSLIKAGLRVAILDGGLDSKKQDKSLNNSLHTNSKQISNAFDLIKTGGYVFNKTYQLLRIKSNIEIIQTLAKGGLSNQWHGICDYFSKEELETVGLPPDEIEKEYKEIAKLIKLTSRKELDLQSKSILKSSKGVTLNSHLYPVSLVHSYRTSSIIEKFKKYKNFTYIPNQLVSKVQDKTRYVEIQSSSIDKNIKLVTTASFLILAAGSINTTRILLRSLNLFNYKTTFLTKANYLAACFYPKALVKKDKSKRKISGQLVMSGKQNHQGLETFFIQLYKFNPRSIAKALELIPLPKFLTYPILSFFAPSLMIADIRFPCFGTKKKFCRLRKNVSGEDVLEISFKESFKEIKGHVLEFGGISKRLRMLGLFPTKTTYDYNTSHYAGGVPYKSKKSKLSVDINSKLHQAKRIYIADASTWKALPSKAPTLTIMANASRVGKKVLENFLRINGNILE